MQDVNRRLVARILGVLASGLVAGASCAGQTSPDEPGSGTGGTGGVSSTGGVGDPAGGVAGEPGVTGGVSNEQAQTGGEPSVSAGTGGMPTDGGVDGAGGVTTGGMKSASGAGGRLPSNCYDSGVGVCCTREQCVAPDEVAEAFPGAMLGSGGEGGSASDAAPAAGQANSPGGEGALGCPVFKANWLCGWITDPPTERDGLCCYTVTSGSCCGRPFVVAREARVAPVQRGAGWSADAGAVELRGLDAATRNALARAWLDDARMEHASVAAFARFVLQLLSLGAPRTLVDRAQAAIGDELRHAALCFELAGRYAGESFEPGPLPLDGALAAEDLPAIAALVVTEGCVGETVAAAIVAEQARLAEDPALAALLASIAEDETRHAELAWAFANWALRTGGAPVRRAIERAFADAAPSDDQAPCAQSSTADPLAAHGRLGPRARAQLAAQTYQSVIAPCARALFAGV